MESQFNSLLDVVSDLCRRYEITALDDFIESCRSFEREETLNIAILGRFKTGKSTFLNSLIGREVVPVGVIPVTAAIIELEYSHQERAEIRYLDGRTETAPLAVISEFVAEEGNPNNEKEVAVVRIGLPGLERYRGIRFVDTPGLESVFAHNTAASMNWLPNVGLAFVGVSSDVPLSQHDIRFIEEVSRYTPNVSILLTKVDVLTETQLAEVMSFIEEQIERNLHRSIRLFPYSVRAGFENLRTTLDDEFLAGVRARSNEERLAVFRHKLKSLVDASSGYLRMALKSAETSDSEKAGLRERILGQKESLEDARTALRLIVRHAAGATRTRFEDLLEHDESRVKERLLTALEADFPSWIHSLANATNRFDDWLRDHIDREMTSLSKKHQREFIQPIHHVRRQLAQSLQDFRNHLSEHALNALGVPLPATDIDFPFEEPQSPDVRIGKIFDRNWELLSFIVPMPLIQGALKRHFRKKIDDVVFTNLSRLASQWEEIVNGALLVFQAEAIRRLETLISTVERMLDAAGHEAPGIQADLEDLERSTRME